MHQRAPIKTLTILLVLTGLLFSGILTVVAQDDDATIADIVAGNAGLSILLEALEAADLTEVLDDPDGTFTVFAPNNRAFNEFLDEAGIEAEDLLADTEMLTDVLLHHVVGEVLDAETVSEEENLTTLQAQGIIVTVDEDGVLLDDTARVIVPDLEADNGIVHLIDAVLVPTSDDMAEDAEETDVEIVDVEPDAELASPAEAVDPEDEIDVSEVVDAEEPDNPEAQEGDEPADTEDEPFEAAAPEDVEADAQGIDDEEDEAAFEDEVDGEAEVDEDELLEDEEDIVVAENDVGEGEEEIVPDEGVEEILEELDVEAERPQGLGVLMLLIGIGAAILVGGVALSQDRTPDDEA